MHEFQQATLVFPGLVGLRVDGSSSSQPSDACPLPERKGKSFQSREGEGHLAVSLLETGPLSFPFHLPDVSYSASSLKATQWGFVSSSLIALSITYTYAESNEKDQWRDTKKDIKHFAERHKSKTGGFWIIINLGELLL